MFKIETGFVYLHWTQQWRGKTQLCGSLENKWASHSLINYVTFGFNIKQHLVSTVWVYPCFALSYG